MEDNYVGMNEQHTVKNMKAKYNPYNGFYVSRHLLTADYESDMHNLQLNHLVCAGTDIHLKYRGTDDIFRIVALRSLDGKNETQVVKNFVESHDFPIALNYHSYSNLLIYPLGYEYDNPISQEDLDIFIEYGEDMVQYNGYELGSGPELLYPVNGEACDWMYGDQGIFAYTPEIGGNSDGFWPQTSRIVPLAEENLYPNQFLALVAGSKYQLEVSVEEGPYTTDNSYPLFISIFNQGLSVSNGDVIVQVESSNNIEFELEEVVLSSLNAREYLNLGGITYFSPNISSGSVETITVNVYDDDGYVYSKSLQIIIGETEVNSGKYQLKNMADGEQGEVVAKSCAKEIKKQLKSYA